jgi:hypothetical protein
MSSVVISRYPFTCQLVQRHHKATGRGGDKSISKASSVNAADANGHSNPTAAARVRQSCTAPWLTFSFPAMTLTLALA